MQGAAELLLWRNSLEIAAEFQNLRTKISLADFYSYACSETEKRDARVSE
jgi:hypothetical protein